MRIFEYSGHYIYLMLLLLLLMKSDYGFRAFFFNKFSKLEN